MDIEPKQSYKRVRSLHEGISLLDADVNTMFAFIPLQNNDFLRSFTQNIRNKELCSYFSAAFNETTQHSLEDMLPKELSPFAIIPASNSNEYRLTPSKSAKFNDLSGHHVDLEMPSGLFMQTVAIQSDNRRAISRTFHRDSRMFTVNIYSEGDPLRYRINDHLIHIKAPAIFMHRGIRHPFGINAAVEHQGREQKNPRANVAFDFERTEPIVDIDIL